MQLKRRVSEAASTLDKRSYQVWLKRFGLEGYRKSGSIAKFRGGDLVG
jgi:hypothetical protein